MTLQLSEAKHLIVGASLIWHAMVKNVGVCCGRITTIAAIGPVGLHAVHQHLYRTKLCFCMTTFYII